MNTYILITGASSGIGYHMAQQLATLKYNLILVARNAEKLSEMQQSLSKKHGISAQVFPTDLSDPEAAKQLFAKVKSQQLVVSYLVNNAGAGMYGQFIETNLDKELAMINLNVNSLVVLTKLFAQDMLTRKSGKIMNVASILAFLPFPYYSVYSATKSFVLAFSETISAELAGTGVEVITFSPGTVETSFHSPEMRKTNAMSANKPMPADVVAEMGVKFLLHGKGKKVAGFMNWFLTNLPRVTPDVIMMKIKKNLASLKTAA